MKLPQRLVVLGLTISVLSACSSSQPDYSKIPESELFSKAHKEIKSGTLKNATTLFEQMDKIYPFGPYSEQVQLDLIYSYYKTSEYSLAIASIDRFLKLNPTHPNVDWVIYMRGLCNMIMDDNQIQSWFGVDRSSRDQSYATAAFKDMSHLIQRFPGSPYTKDAEQRLIYLKNRLAKYQYYVAKYYTERQAYVAVINRVEYMLSVFPDTLSTRRALHLMENAYKKLGLITEAKQVRTVIEENKHPHS